MILGHVWNVVHPQFNATKPFQGFLHSKAIPRVTWQFIVDNSLPDNSSPDNSSLDNSSPDNSSPDNSSPDNSSPDNLSPDNSLPDNSSRTIRRRTIRHRTIRRPTIRCWTIRRRDFFLTRITYLVECTNNCTRVGVAFINTGHYMRFLCCGYLLIITQGNETITKILTGMKK